MEIFQLHGVNAAEEPVLRRRQMLPFFARLAPTVIGLEACGASHHWARELIKLGHEVKLVPTQQVKAYRSRGKNDAADAEAGCEAMSRRRTRFVPVKSAEAQAALMLASVRELTIRRHTQLVNAIRGHAAEFGLTAPKGIGQVGPLLKRIAEGETRSVERLPEPARELFAQLGREKERIEEDLKAIEAKLSLWHRSNETSRRLTGIPGVGPVVDSHPDCRRAPVDQIK